MGNNNSKTKFRKLELAISREGFKINGKEFKANIRHRSRNRNRQKPVKKNQKPITDPVKIFSFFSKPITEPTMI